MRFKTILIILCFVSMFHISVSVEDYQSLDEVYVEIRCGQLRNSFFPIKYDGEKDKVYLGINALFYFLELYDVDTDLENMKVSYAVKGEKKKINLKSNEAFVNNDELYVDTETLKNKFDFRNITFDYSMLSVGIIPNFLLPYEEREKGKIQRFRLDANKNEQIKNDYMVMDRKFLTPGFLKFNYYSHNFPKDGYINYEYGNQFLYGSLYLRGDLNKTKDIVTYGNLTYDDILGENDLVVGNINMDKPNFIRSSGDIIGISLNNERTYFFRDNGVTVIKGEAEGADTIELYNGPFLLDYIHPNGKNFEFKISDGNMVENYLLKIYYSNGNYEEKKVFSINDLNILPKGKNKINFQVGKDSKKGYKQGNFMVRYGLTDNMTVSTGYNLTTCIHGGEYKFLRNDILYNTRHEVYPTLIEFKNYYEIDKKEDSYNLIITQKYKNLQMRVSHEKYSPYVYKDSLLKSYDSLSLGKSYTRNYLEVGVEEREYYDYRTSKRNNMYFYWNTYMLSPFYFSIKLEKNLNQDHDNYCIYPTVSYYGSFSAVFDGGFEKETRDNRWKEYYNLKLDKRDVEIIKNKLYGDVGVFMRYSSYGEKMRYGVSFSVKFDDFIYIRTNSEIRKTKNGNSEKNAGIEVVKFIDLERPKSKYDNRSSVTNSSIYGKVFLDKNSNSIFDEGDLAIENACIVIDGTRYYSDKNGDYIADGVPSPTVVNLEVDRKTIDPMHKSTFNKIKVKTFASANMRLDVPLDIISIVTGNIYNKLDVSENMFSRKLSLVTIELVKNGKVIEETKPEFDGMYFFEDILPGKYKIRFIYLGPEDIKFSAKEVEVNVDTSGGDSGEYFEGYDVDLIYEHDIFGGEI